MKTLYSLIESPFPLHFPDLFRDLDIAAERFDSPRNLHRAIQKRAPDFFAGEFIYGWGNDYAGATVSNLDVTLRLLEAVAPKAKIIVVMQPNQEAHMGKLRALFTLHAELIFPITEAQMGSALRELSNLVAAND